jgi:hypothetical protein
MTHATTRRVRHDDRDFSPRRSNRLLYDCLIVPYVPAQTD